MKRKRKLKKGQVILLTDGCYSDYCVNGLYKVIKDFYYDDVIRDHIINNKSVGSFFDISPTDIIFNSGLVEEIDYRELHCGAYSAPETIYDAELASIMEQRTKP